MVEIASFVFFDTETTGLPFQERNQTKIIEFSFVAALRSDLQATPYGHIPSVKKLTFVLNPEKSICRKVTQMTGLSLRSLKKAPTFREKFESIVSFLNELPSPICLVAHNGNAFDFKILLAECRDASVHLPTHLYCADSLVGFRSILQGTNLNYSNLETTNQTVADLMTDDEDEDEDEWPDLNLTPEDLDNIENIENQPNTKECKSKKQKQTKKKRSETIKKVFQKISSTDNEKECFKLTSIFKRLLNKEQENAHRAEGDCLMLIQCVVALKKEFLPWVDKNAKYLTEIQPLRRY